MKTFRFLLIFFTCVYLFNSCHFPSSPLSLYWENGKTGYINQQGEIVIPARFAVGEDFSEGLANVREGGLYGYINAKGEWVIRPNYDYATPFSDGLALVYKGDKGLYIDKNGHEVIPPGYMGCRPFRNGVAIIDHRPGHSGLIDRKGKLLLDTNFYSITPVTHNLLLVTRDNEKSFVTDGQGRPLPAFHQYDNFKSLDEGYLLAELQQPDSNNNTSVVLDSTGKALFRLDLRKISTDKFSAGKLIFNKTAYYGNDTYGFMDKNGHILYQDDNRRIDGSFSSNRIFFQAKDAVLLISGEGKTIKEYHGYQREGFQYNYAFVRVNDKYGMIDTMGNYVIRPKYEEIIPEGMTADRFFFRGYDSNRKTRLIGMADRTGKTLLPLTLDNISPEGFKSGLILCLHEGKLAYLNPQGKFIWQEKQNTNKPPLNIDYMHRGYFRVMEEWDEKMAFYQHEWPAPKPIPMNSPLLPRQLQIKVDTTSRDTFDTNYKGYTVFIYNTTDSTIAFDSQDNRLDMKMQARCGSEWKDIEFLPSSWCGNSYYEVKLKSQRYWQLTCPVYEGAQKTRLRLVLYYHSNKEAVYSNEFNGSINPGQLWRKEYYQPSNIMDPYYQ
ncbi:WG repeat-containing protein [Chitinophaga flava]|uniref:WG repeat-containing protein n=1 Tax=Chitinophaga flava TaxID=2259036 RepID=A0A365XT70_9BACT|nr:WG repeat-containing protein [Chitinophaga flava]RBL89533.1 hypothetical protein DF182_23770 [Chitinophaga flava]